MATRAKASSKTAARKDSTAHLGFETKLWLAADKLRNNMDAAEYKHVVLGLIFLKYISDSFEAHHAKLRAGDGLSACNAQADDYAGADPEDPDEYRAENMFWVPQEARWFPSLARGSRATIPQSDQKKPRGLSTASGQGRGPGVNAGFVLVSAQDGKRKM